MYFKMTRLGFQAEPSHQCEHPTARIRNSKPTLKIWGEPCSHWRLSSGSAQDFLSWALSRCNTAMELCFNYTKLLSVRRSLAQVTIKWWFKWFFKYIAKNISWIKLLHSKKYGLSWCKLCHIEPVWNAPIQQCVIKNYTLTFCAQMLCLGFPVSFWKGHRTRIHIIHQYIPV